MSRSRLFRSAEYLESRVLLSAQPVGLNPAMVRHAYGFDQVTFAHGSVQGDGRGQIIAIVDAHDDPNIAADLDSFDKAFSVRGGQSLYAQYGAAGQVLQKIRLNNASADAGWSQEIALDVEWAHAIAPGARILLVEAASESLADLLTAVNWARWQPGVSAVSMSWGGAEFGSETAYDGYFTTPPGHTGETFLASSGDSGAGSSWPAVSPNVVGVGGTQLAIGADGSYRGESGWSGSGGDASAYEAAMTYQYPTTGDPWSRYSPDVAYDASPASGFAVYDSVPYQGASGWLRIGGTSAGAPQWAALVAVANEGRALAGQTSLDGATQTLPALYQMSGSNFHDVMAGDNGFYLATPGYDLVTGLGSPVANRIVPVLAGVTGSVAASHAFAWRFPLSYLSPLATAHRFSTPAPGTNLSVNAAAKTASAPAAAPPETPAWRVSSARSGASQCGTRLPSLSDVLMPGIWRDVT